MKVKVLTLQLFMIGMVFTIINSCKKEELLTPSTNNKPDREIQIPEDTIIDQPYISDKKIVINIFDQSAQVNTVLSERTPYNINYIFSNTNEPIQGTSTTFTHDKTNLLLSKFKFGSNEQLTTRRPQGIANYGKYVINSWQFQDNSDWNNNCKLTITDPTLGKYFNLVPVALDASETNKFKHIDSHAGGITVVDHYLYIADGNAILIFDLDKIYLILDTNDGKDPDVADGQVFIYKYTYMIPQVGKMSFVTQTGASASYMSQTEINSQKYFVIGNFFMRDSDYDKGDKSMIWLLPIQEGSYPYPTIKINRLTEEYITLKPVFPSGSEKNLTVTRIQGVIVKDNILVINRSWGAKTSTLETYQLIVMKYPDILTSTSNSYTNFFSGTYNNKQSYNHKNWIYSCEDLEYYNDKIWTTTEYYQNVFPSFGDRANYSTSWSSIVNLMAPVTP